MLRKSPETSYRNKIFLGQRSGNLWEITVVVQINSTAKSVSHLQCKSVSGSCFKKKTKKQKEKKHAVSAVVKYAAFNTKLICLVDTKYINIRVQLEVVSFLKLKAMNRINEKPGGITEYGPTCYLQVQK